MKYILMKLYVRPEYQDDIEEVAEEISAAMINNSDEGDDPIKSSEYEIRDLES